MKTKDCLLVMVLAVQSVFSYAEERPSVTARLEQQYFRVEFVNEDGLEYYELKNSNWDKGIADVNGKEILPCIYDFISPIGFKDGNFEYDYSKIHYWQIHRNNRAGIADAKGKIIIPCMFEGYPMLESYKSMHGNTDIKDGYAFLVGDKIKALYSKKGKELIPLSRGYNYIGLWKNPKDGAKYILVRKGEKQGLCDINGKELLPPIYKNVYLVNEDYPTHYINFESERGQGLYNWEMKEIAVSPKYYQVSSDGNIYYILEERDGKYKFYYDDHLLTEADAHISTYNIPEDYTKFQNNGQWGLINEITGQLLPFRFDDVMEIKDGTVSVMENGVAHLYSLAALEKGVKESIVSISKEDAAKGVVSDADTNIPKAKKQDENTFAVIIANENYNEFIAPCAENDGKIFKAYCAQALGLPSENILYYEDATINHIYAAVKRLKDLAEVYDEGCKVIFYYSGQGVSDERTKEMYLLPTDGSLKSISSTCYSISKLYQEIGSLPNVEQALFLIDAPFNGMTKENKPLVQARGVAIKSAPNKLTGNSIAIEAATEGQTAHVYPMQNHGLFTYCLLKALQSNSGNKPIVELIPDVIKNVKDRSTRDIKVPQTVQIKKAKP